MTEDEDSSPDTGLGFRIDIDASDPTPADTNAAGPDHDHACGPAGHKALEAEEQHQQQSDPLWKRMASSGLGYTTAKAAPLAAAPVPLVSKLPEAPSRRNSYTSPWTERFCGLMRYSVSALKERNERAWLVLFVALGSIVLRAAIYAFTFGWGTHWQWLPVHFMAVFVQPAAALAVSYISFSAPYEEAQKKPALGLGLLADIVLHMVPIAYAAAQTDGNFPLERLGSRVWFTVAISFTYFLCCTFAVYTAPGNAWYWKLPWRVVVYTLAYNAMRMVDPIIDVLLIVDGLRLAKADVCPFRGSSQSCLAHYIVLGWMTFFLTLDCFAAMYLTIVVSAISDNDERRERLRLKTEIYGLTFEFGTTIGGVMFVLLGMTSSQGVSVDYVCTCAAYTGMTAMWTAFLVLPAHYKTRIRQRIRRLSEQVARRASSMGTRVRIRVAPMAVPTMGNSAPPAIAKEDANAAGDTPAASTPQA